MERKFLLFVVLCVPLFAQYSFNFSCLDDTVKIAFDTTTTITFYFRLQNTGTQPDSYAFDLRVIDSVAGWDEMFCVGGSCGVPGTILYDYLMPGAVDTNIDVSVYLTNSYGIEKLNFHVNSVKNPVLKDSINIYVKKELSIGEKSIINSEISRQRLEVFPNPFRDAITLRSHISYPLSRISLRIYDAAGYLVRQWDYKTIGLSDQVIWNGADDSGHRLPAGIYFAMFDDGNVCVIKKVIKLD